MLTDCPVGWGHEPRLFAQVIDGAVDCLFWPLYEVVEGRYGLTYVPPAVLPVAEWLALRSERSKRTGWRCSSSAATGSRLRPG